MIGEKLGYPAHMSDLTRIESAGFKLNECNTLTEIQELMEADKEAEFLLPFEQGLYICRN